MRKLRKIVLWLSGISLLVLIMSFSSGGLKSLRTNGIEIEVDYSSQLYFTDASEIEQIVRDEYPYFDSLNLREINIPLLEESIENHPSIRRAEVYSALNGSLRVHVWQKRPVARVQNSSTGYYIDEEGEIMQLSPRFSAMVPMIKGDLKEEELQKVYDFWRRIERDEFFKSFFNGLEIDPTGNWILYPRPGNHRVLLGKPLNLEKKIKRLKVFYQTVVKENNLDSLKTLNLKYRGQVICTKHQ